MPKILTPRFVFAIIGIVCVGMLVTGWYMQYGPGRQQPCPLCILQRYAFMALAFVCLLAAVHGPQRMGTLVYAAIAELIASAGIGLAVWQVTKGPSMTSCLADPIGEFVNGLPFANWWPEYFFANGGCADKYPPIFGLHAPQWALVSFATFLALITLAMLASIRQKSNA